MRVTRSLIVVLAAFLAVGLAIPAQARSFDMVRVSALTASVEVGGLDVAQSARVQELWGEFVTAIPGQASCLLASPPRIEAKSDMAPRAAYAPASATLFVKPGDLDRIVVFHELGHHLDFACGAAEEIGDDLRAAQGIAANKPWWKHGDPVSWPAEYFANAVAIALGEESRHDVQPATVALVEQWMGISGETVGAPADIDPIILGEPGPDALRLA